MSSLLPKNKPIWLGLISSLVACIEVNLAMLTLLHCDLESKSTSSSVHLKELTASLSVFFGVSIRGGLPYIKGGDARREISNEPLKGINLGVA